jgi:hypothetical protein
MLSRWQFGILTILGAAALALAIGNAVIATRTRDAQAELIQRQQYIQQSVALEALYRDMVKALAEAGLKTGDRQVLDLLAAQGIDVSYQPGAPAPAAPESAPALKPRR